MTKVQNPLEEIKTSKILLPHLLDELEELVKNHRSHKLALVRAYADKIKEGGEESKFNQEGLRALLEQEQESLFMILRGILVTLRCPCSSPQKTIFARAVEKITQLINSLKSKTQELQNM